MKWPWVSRRSRDDSEAVLSQIIQGSRAEADRLRAELAALTKMAAPVGYVVAQRDVGPGDVVGWFLHWDHVVYTTQEEAVAVAERSAVEFGQRWQAVALTHPDR